MTAALAAVVAVVLMPGAVFGQSGTVFRDYNGDGIKQAKENGVQGVTVNLYINASPMPDQWIGSALTDTAGQYDFAFPVSGRGAGATERVRMEFEVPDDYGCSLSNKVDFFSVNGVTHGTAVRFVTGSSTGVNFALNNPGEWVQSTNPKVFISCYTNGDPLAGGTTGTDPAFVMFNWLDFGIPPSHSQSTGANEPSKLAEAREVGALYGTAFSRPAQKVFASAVMRRHM